MIKTSGYRVSPTEVEEIAFASGLVREAVALGVEDRQLGQRIELVVVPVSVPGDETALLNFCRQQAKSRLIYGP